MKGIDVRNGLVPVGEFKAQASRLLREMRESGRPLVITQNGRAAAVVVPPEMWAQLADEYEENRLTREAMADIDAGRWVEGDDMERWVKSWGTAAEGPPPPIR